MTTITTEKRTVEIKFHPQNHLKSMDEMLKESKFINKGAYLDHNANIVVKNDMKREHTPTFTFLDGWKINVIYNTETKSWDITKSPNQGIYEAPLNIKGEE